jgi:hypothetical protein
MKEDDKKSETAFKNGESFEGVPSVNIHAGRQQTPPKPQPHSIFSIYLTLKFRMSLQQSLAASVSIALADPNTGVPGPIVEIRVPLPHEGQPLTLGNIVDFLSKDNLVPASERDPSRAGRALVRLWIPDPSSTQLYRIAVQSRNHAGPDPLSFLMSSDAVSTVFAGRPFLAPSACRSSSTGACSQLPSGKVARVGSTRGR